MNFRSLIVSLAAVSLITFLCSFEGCQPHPITPTVPNPSLRGMADLHLHQMSNLGYGGQAFHGKAFGDVNSALPWCTPAHGIGGTGDLIFNTMTTALYCPPGGALRLIGHLPGGNPQFDGWPRWDNISHQAVYEDWLFRAYKGGLRLMVMLAVNNEHQCQNANKAPGRTCADDEAAKLQIQAAKDMEAYIDTKSGGPGKGWYRIAFTADQARSIVRQDKLAVILGIELDYPFESYRSGFITEADINTKVDEYYNLGVRHVFPIHFNNNAFGGTSFDKILHQPVSDLLQFDFLRPYKIITTNNPVYRHDNGTTNIEGLTNLGKILIRKLMDKGMIIDVDHTSALSRKDILNMASRINYPAIVTGHTGFVELSKGDEKSHEGNMLPSEIQTIKNLGGMVSIILNQGKDIREWPTSTPIRHTCPGSIETFAQAYLYAKDKMAGEAVAIGSDLNGGINAFGPRFGTEACPCNWGSQTTLDSTKYPFQSVFNGELMSMSQVGDKTFNINKDGMAHVGMYPDMLADLKAMNNNIDLEPLMRSAGKYVGMWFKAELMAATNSFANEPRLTGGTIFPDKSKLPKDFDVIEYTIEPNAVSTGDIELKLCLENGISFQKWIRVQGLPRDLNSSGSSPCDAFTIPAGQFTAGSNTITFFKSKALGLFQNEVRTLPVVSLGTITGGCRVTFRWKRDESFN